MERSIVECSSGAYYSTIWVPLVSFKALRLGNTRVQPCPIHHKWEKTWLVAPDTLEPEVLAKARATRDSRIP